MGATGLSSSARGKARTRFRGPVTVTSPSRIAAWNSIRASRTCVIGRRCTPTETAHDRDGTFVTEAYAAMAERGYLKIAVPEDLGGFGATLRQVTLAEGELARWSGSSALAVAHGGYRFS